MSRNIRKSGFTLVEILIVVVILGILAAIVIPQFTNASQDARKNSAYTLLQTVRSQLELYQVQHNGNYPDLSTNWDQLTHKTDASGTVDPSSGTTFGPYLQDNPKNPFTSGYTMGTDWTWDATNHKIAINGFDESTGLYTAPASGS